MLERKITELRDGEVKTYMTTPEDWGVRLAQSREIRCADPWLSAVKNVAVLRGVCHDANKDLLTINASQFLYVAGKAKSRKEGTKMARAAIDDGLAIEKLRAWVEASGGEYGVFEMMLAASSRDDMAERMKPQSLGGKVKVVGSNAA